MVATTLTGSFSAFLVLVFFAQNGLALPYNRYAGVVHVPLHRVAERDDIHPSIALQKRINRNHQRLARMTGWKEPSAEELRDNLRKRIVILESEPESNSLSKRYTGPRPKVDSSKLYPVGAPLVQSFDASPGNNAVTVANAQLITPAGPVTAQNSVGLDNELNDIGYLIKVQVGTPPRDFTFLADSGSADVWVGSENCKSQEGGDCGNHKFLGTKSSTSFVDTRQPFTINYGAGSVTGTSATDIMTIGGLKIDNQIIGAANTESTDFASNDTPYDGIMGLSLSILSQMKGITPIDALSSKGAIGKPIVSYKLSRLADGKNDGQISFGGLDPTKFDSKQLATIDNVSGLGFWEGSMDAIAVDNKDLGLKSRTAIFDTGTTVVSAPPADALAVHTAIPGAKADGTGGFTVPCHSTTSVALTFGSMSFSIDPRDLIGKPIDASKPDGDCQSGIHSGSAGGPPQWLLGDVFLKNVYLSTDASANRITLAKLL